MSQAFKDFQTNSDQANVIVEEKIFSSVGDITYKKYARGKLLGKGGFAKCFELTNLDSKKIYASKIILKSSLQKTRARQKLLSEIKIHRSLHHPSIVNFEHVFEDSDNVYLLLEICTNQTLNELLKRRKRLVDIEVQCYIAQIISALKYLHSNKVIHRDLKLGNLFLSDKMELKLGDFGLATKLDYDFEKKKTVCGTPNYIAPEILDGKSGHSYEVDVWSLGVIIYTLLIGKPPFETPDVKTTYKKIRMNSYSFPEMIPISDAAKNLITKILVLDPAKRLTLNEISNHPFMNNGGSLPKLLPLSTLAMPPSDGYIKQFLPKSMSSNAFLKTDYLTNKKIPSLFDCDVDVEIKKAYNPSSLAIQGSRVEIGNEQNQIITEVYVKKWVDYSSKYGLGYLLSNGCCGVYFNDFSKMILNFSGTSFEYVEKLNGEKTYITTEYSLNDYPKQIQKKVTLLTHFKSYLESESKNADPFENADNTPEKNNMVFVKQWMKTKHAIIFKLSNKIVQVDFTDKTEILLSSQRKLVTYINKKNEKSDYSLAKALNSSYTEMTKRLKYTEKILTHMRNNYNIVGNIGTEQYENQKTNANKQINKQTKIK